MIFAYFSIWGSTRKHNILMILELVFFSFIAWILFAFALIKYHYLSSLNVFMHMLRQFVILYFFMDDLFNAHLSEETTSSLRAKILLVVLSISLLVSDTGSGLEWVLNKYLLNKRMLEEFNIWTFSSFISAESEVKNMAAEN